MKLYQIETKDKSLTIIDIERIESIKASLPAEGEHYEFAEVRVAGKAFEVKMSSLMQALEVAEIPVSMFYTKEQLEEIERLKKEEGINPIEDIEGELV